MADRFAEARHRMVALIRRRGVETEAVLQAMDTVPRERFVPEDAVERAYDDGPLPIGKGQTISQPYVVALMIEAACVRKDSRVLEVGAGSGYSAAVMAAMGAHVHAIERHARLTASAEARMTALGLDVAFATGDGTDGWADAAPFDAIVVTAGGPSVPETLRDQLATGGHLVIPVGRDRGDQILVRVTRSLEDDFFEEALGHVSFVSLIGTHGWPS